MNKWFKVPKLWQGDSCYIIGGGSSLKDVDLTPLMSKWTIGCNDTFKKYPLIDICCFGDQGWYRRQKKALQEFSGLIVTNSVNLLSEPEIKICRRLNFGLHYETDWQLCWNCSTGALAINLAVLLGVKRIFLLGYDMKVTNGKHNWYRENESYIKDDIYEYKFIKHFTTIAEGLKKLNIECYNANPDSALDVFPKIELEEAFQWKC